MSAALAEAPRVSVPVSDDRLLVIAAHPDDESLGAGGLIAAAAARGAAVEVVIASDGEASHPRSPTHRPRQLASIRRTEVLAALGELGPSVTGVFLGLPDGELSAHRAELAAQIAERLPRCTHVISPWRGDRHPDHEACAEAVRAASAGRSNLAHWQYPIWAWHWADPASSDLPWPLMRRLDLEVDAAAVKRRAVACHVSQHTPLSAAAGDEAILPAHVRAYFARDFETFILEPVHPAGQASYFDALYAAAEDPWGLADRFYEKRKRDLLLASLPRACFRRAFEPGCATGLLTTGLAKRCAEVIAWDCADAAVRQARARLNGLASVRIEQHRIPGDWPPGEFDLVVLSEVGYYCPDPADLAMKVRDCLSSDGVVIACHWRHQATDHPQTGHAVHDAIAKSGLRLLAHHSEADFLLDIWSRSGESVAHAEGILE